MNFINHDLIVLLFGYLRRLISLPQLREWLAANIWALADSTSPLDRMLVGELELALAEYDRGDRDEHYLREYMLFLLHLPNPDLAPQLREVPLTLSAA